MKSNVNRTARVTISLPSDLFAKGEVERRRRRVSRSRYVADLYREHLGELELRERIARYAAAYNVEPLDATEDAVLAAGRVALGTIDASPSEDRPA